MASDAASCLRKEGQALKEEFSNPTLSINGRLKEKSLKMRSRYENFASFGQVIACATSIGVTLASLRGSRNAL